MKTIFTILALSFFTFCNAQFISNDDMKHFAVGAGISAGTYSIVYAKTKNKTKAFWYSFATSTLAGLSKEIYDGYIISGRFDAGEAISTSIGGFVTSYSFNIFTGKKKKKKKEELGFTN